MSLIKINYHQTLGEKIDSCFSLDGVGFEPELLLNTVSKDSVYWECPAWKHKASRTFLIKSPVDMTFTIDVENQTLGSTNLNQQQFDEYCGPTFMTNWCSKEKVTIQLSTPRFLFWTNQKNIWVETRPHFNTVVKNNLTSFSAWFNLSSWTRQISFAFDVVDPSKPIVIKRGDPLFEVCFYSKNLDSGVLLKKSYPPKEVIDKVSKISHVKSYIRNLSKHLMFKEQKSKCPFEFLWK